MIDIHCHLLYGVDDGARSPKESEAMLTIAKAQGIEKIILTPHYRKDFFPYSLKDIERSYFDVMEMAEEKGIEIYLGCEYHVDSEIVENLFEGRCLTLAESYYVLCEYSTFGRYDFLKNSLEELTAAGFTPVIAHAERYECFRKKPELLADVRKMGSLIQINADSVLGIEGAPLKRFCKTVLKGGLADIIASDSHGVRERQCRLKECFDHVAKRYGEERSKKLFIHNPEKIIRASAEGR